MTHRTISWNAPYTLSGKEKDTETGFHYFGARYYDSGLSIWLSVDPMSDKYPSLSAYNYCANNPVILVDPDGRLCTFSNEETETFVNKLIDPNSKLYNKAFHDEYKKLESQKDFTYEFQGWATEPTGDQGEFREVSNNKAIIGFTMGETKDTKNEVSGQGTKFRLFEETFHATQYESNNRKIENSCITEAEAWQFAAINAPGNKFSYYNSNDGFMTPTFIGSIKNADIPKIAGWLKNGKYDNAHQLKAMYPDFILGTADQLIKYNINQVPK